MGPLDHPSQRCMGVGWAWRSVLSLPQNSMPNTKLAAQCHINRSSLPFWNAQCIHLLTWYIPVNEPSVMVTSVQRSHLWKKKHSQVICPAINSSLSYLFYKSNYPKQHARNQVFLLTFLLGLGIACRAKAAALLRWWNNDKQRLHNTHKACWEPQWIRHSLCRSHRMPWSWYCPKCHGDMFAVISYRTGIEPFRLCLKRTSLNNGDRSLQMVSSWAPDSW